MISGAKRIIQGLNKLKTKIIICDPGAQNQS